MAWLDFTFTRRCIAVDLGESRIKAILAEKRRGRIEILHAFSLDLHEEGLLTLEETNRHISRILQEMGDYPVSLVIPQHIAISHLISLPADEKGRSWTRRIEEETHKLTGLSESAIVYDYFPLKPFPKNQNPVWVTVSRELELANQIGRLRASNLMVSEATNTGNALASAFIATQPPVPRVALVDIGATATTVVVLVEMQPVYATAFPAGGELLTEMIAASRGIDFDEAEVVKKTEKVFSELGRDPEFIDAVNRWQGEFRKVLSEAAQILEDSSDFNLPIMLSGGSSLQPGFVDFLRKEQGFDYQLWKDEGHDFDAQTFGVVYGAALSGLKVAPIKTSLLPRSLQQARFRAMQLSALNAFVMVLLAVLFVVLSLDVSSKREGLRAKTAALENLEAAYAQTPILDELLEERNEKYRRIVPVVQQQERTRDLLLTLDLMQQVRADHNIWFTLLADGKSYLREMNRSSSSESTTLRGRSNRFSPDQTLAEDQWKRWNRFIVELAVPAEGRETLRTLRSVVDALRDSGIYQNVDTLALSDQQALVSEEVTLPGRTFSLSLKLDPGNLSPLTETAPPDSSLQP